MGLLEDTSILFRYCKAEAPYVQAFLQHYASFGANNYISIVQSDEDKASIENNLETLGGKATAKIIQLSAELNCNRALIRLNPKLIKNQTEFILNVDCDEFLFTKNQEPHDGQKKFNMHEFMKNKSRAHLKWVMTTNSTTTTPSQFGYQMGFGKDIAKSDLITGMKNVHIFKTKEQEEDHNPYQGEPQIGLAHHWGRTLNDTLLKLCYQRERHPDNPKNNDFNALESFLINQELPKRFRYMAFIEAREKTINISTTNHQDLYDLDCEDCLLNPYASKEQINLLQKLYNEYLERIKQRGQAYIQKHTKGGVNNTIETIISLQDLRLEG